MLPMCPLCKTWKLEHYPELNHYFCGCCGEQWTKESILAYRSTVPPRSGQQTSTKQTSGEQTS